MYAFLLLTFGRTTDNLMRLKFVSCDIERVIFIFFSTDLVRKKTLVKILLDRVKFLVDIFHVLKHRVKLHASRQSKGRLSRAIVLIWKHSEKLDERTQHPQNRIIVFLIGLNTCVIGWLNSSLKDSCGLWLKPVLN